MPEVQANDGVPAIREPLRRIDSVLNFARKLAHEQGGVPPGLATDFHEARKELERSFVLNFDSVDEKLQKQLREFLNQTKSLTAEQIGAHVDKLSQRARSALNQVMIHGEGQLTLTDEIGKVRFTDEELLIEPPEQVPSAAYALMTAPAPVPPSRPAGSTPRLRRALAAVVLIGVLGGVVIAAAFLIGPWSGGQQVPDTNDDIAGNTVAPRNAPPDNRPVVDNSGPFNAEAAGYTMKLEVLAVSPGINPLETASGSLSPGELARLMIGYEELIFVLEPQRLAFEPGQTAARLSAFGQSAVNAEPAWREDRKQFLDAFIGHVRKELQLTLYPAETEGSKLLISDVLYAGGGGRLSLVVTVQALGQTCNAPTKLVSSLGVSRPLVGIELADGMHTFNGESFGLREGRQPVLLLAELLIELSSRLRPTLATPEARTLCSGVVLQHAGTLTFEQAREALRDLNLDWLIKPADDADAATLLRHNLAARLQPAVCETLLKAAAGGDAAEALAVYRLANAAADTDRANRALIVLGERAPKGQLIDGEPLPLVVGDLLVRQGKARDAEPWFTRAMQEQPDDPRPAVRLITSRTGAARLELCREAYLRGEREIAFLRVFAESAAQNGDDLLALKLLDEVCAGDRFDAIDLQNAALLCMSLGRNDWVLERLAAHAELAAGEPRLQRLELICELSLNGFSERAKQLAADWRKRGEMDEFVDSLLKRYGG